MKKFEEMRYTEQKELAEMLWSWLGDYTAEVINNVIPKVDDIINNESAMFMLKELHLRKKEEEKHNIDNLRLKLDIGSNDFMRCNALTHSDSYKDILNDMYIHPEWQRSKKTEDNAE